MSGDGGEYSQSLVDQTSIFDCMVRSSAALKFDLLILGTRVYIAGRNSLVAAVVFPPAQAR